MGDAFWRCAGPGVPSKLQVSACSSLLMAPSRKKDLKSDGEDLEAKEEPLGLVIGGCYSLRAHNLRETAEDSGGCDGEVDFIGCAQDQRRRPSGGEEDLPEGSEGRDKAVAKCVTVSMPGVRFKVDEGGGEWPQDSDKKNKTRRIKTIRVKCNTGAGLQKLPRGNVKLYNCTICGFTCHFKSKLVRHLRVHTGEKPYQCYICKERFAVNYTLTTHIRTHTGEKPFKCNICKERFAQKSPLTRHMRTHTGEKPYKCNICKERFAQKSSLILHIRTHTGEKPYKCNICKERFAQKSPLTRHMRTHTGEKPYQCNICKERFAQKSSLILHMRTHTGEKPFKCDICKQLFAREDHLKKHITSHIV
ncbi:zinc finger protein OZF-like isoform X2 [Frankliniella occidentalis]|nr:zinc finger protein OZF-like isoform X2 [Frankliniella occidentalis]